MIFFLYGPDTYRSRQKMNEIIENYQKVHKSGLNLKYFSGSELSFSEFKAETKQTAMFKEKKLFVLTDVFSNPEFKEKLLKDIKAAPDSWTGTENIFLFHEKTEVSAKNPLYLFFKKHAKCQEFTLLGGQKLKNWVKKEFENYQIRIGEGALDKLIDFVGNNLWQMANEIRKLVSFRSEHRNAEISDKDIALLVRPKIEPDIFETIDAIASRDKKRAIKLLKIHLEKGDSPPYLLSMINYQFRNILIIKDLIEKNLSPYNLTNFHPYVVRKSVSLAKKFSIPELKKIYRKMLQVDLDIKTGKMEPETALDLLIAGL